ncbi:MAG: hydroxylamine reductase [Anaerolineae bacterium]|nr:hydroxylamine reductase [Anaerolineae bacterium]
MFCYQCQETAKNEGCTVRGVCGKSPEVAQLQDLLIWLLKGISFWGVRARPMGVVEPETDIFIAKALFATITNANFDPERFVALIKEAVERREALRLRAQAACRVAHGSDCNGVPPDHRGWIPENYEVATLIAKGQKVGIMADPNLNPDIRSLRELMIYGLKGLAAYAEHAYVLEHTNDVLFAFMQEVLDATTNDELGANDLVALVLRTGEMGVEAMRLLDEANTSTYGHPEPTQVALGVRPGPGILISGHDLRDLDELLQQTEGTGINIYTHGEMLPANAYPAFKKYAHFAGNYGGSWWHQQQEFDTFGGPILMTTNCIVPVKASYEDRIFTTGMAGWPGSTHIPDREPGKQKDFSAIIAKAKTCAEPKQLETGTIPIGFAHNTVMSVADKVIAAVQAGDIKRFVVMGGCDGRHKSREYYTHIAETLPKDHVILTAGCAKYRYNKLDLGTITSADGSFTLPRILDAGQCNDSYSLAYIALQLKAALGLEDINDLPISYDIAWYEQKAVIVLLALLYLGVRHIRLGPTLPAFVSPGVLDVLVKHFDLKPIGTAETDVAAIAMGQ